MEHHITPKLSLYLPEYPYIFKNYHNDLGLQNYSDIQGVFQLFIETPSDVFPFRESSNVET